MSKEQEIKEMLKLYTKEDLWNANQRKMQKIADLEAKLEQLQKERELDNSFWKQECDSLQKALAEKDKEIEEMRHFKVTIGTMENNQVDISSTTYTNQAKTDFAIEQLEKVKEFIFEQDIEITRLNKICDFIDQQIKELKDKK